MPSEQGLIDVHNWQTLGCGIYQLLLERVHLPEVGDQVESWGQLLGLEVLDANLVFFVDQPQSLRRDPAIRVSSVEEDAAYSQWKSSPALQGVAGREVVNVAWIKSMQ